MNLNTRLKLEYEKIKQELAQYAMSYLGRQHIEQLEPLTDLKKIERLLFEVEEAKAILDTGSSVPLPTLDGMEGLLSHVEKGFMLMERDFVHVGKFLGSVLQLKRYMTSKQEVAPNVSAVALSLASLDDLRNEIDRCLVRDQLADDASHELLKIRKQMYVSEDRLKRKLGDVMRKYKSYMQEPMYSMRQDHYVLPIKREFKRLVKGSLFDESASGQTVFIEPAELAHVSQDLVELRVREEQEKMKILSGLTGLIEANMQAFSLNMEIAGYYDFLFAKAKYARTLHARTVTLNDAGYVSIRGGRHPLLGKDSVPLDFRIGESFRSLVITGPNTGGKTVTLKTVGLLTLMVQSGLLVPVEKESHFSIFTSVMVDIGDGQSLEESLSTFSAHIKNVIQILREAGSRTLVLLDELAAGTDPGEGIGLSIAVLEELFARGATTIATTHFNEIKRFATETKGFENARMEFDLETLRPQYKLKIGEAGNSYAFFIAMKLGMPEAIIERSKQLVKRQGVLSGEAFDFTVRSPQPDKEADGAAHSRPTAQRNATPQRDRLRKPVQHAKTFQIGDRVWIHTMKTSGIVRTLPDAKGMVELMVKKERVQMNVKRLSLFISRDELYPGDYDMDIVLESKSDRRKRKTMHKHHAPGVVIEHPEDPTTLR